MNLTAPGSARWLAGSAIALSIFATSRAHAEDEPKTESSEEATGSAEDSSEGDGAGSDENSEVNPDETSEADSDEPSEADSDEGAAAHEHDGWYFRLAAGAAYFSDAVESEPLVGYGGGVAKGTLAGTGWAGHAAAGYTIAKGMIVGASFLIHYIPTVDANNAVIAPTPFGDIEPVVTFQKTTLSLIGPFISYYPDPEFGLHLDACVGFGVLSMNEGNAAVVGTQQSLGDQAGSGIAAMLGVGFDIWIGSDISLGLLAEVMGGLGAGDDGSGTRWNHVVFTPALLIAATYN